jgi:hypothetical protein
MQNVLVDDRRIWVDLYAKNFTEHVNARANAVTAPNQWRASTRAGPMIPSEMAKEFAV